jgi:hypothetical protein
MIFRKLLACMHTKTQVSTIVLAYEHLLSNPSKSYKTDCLSQLAWISTLIHPLDSVVKLPSLYHSVIDMCNRGNDHDPEHTREPYNLSRELPKCRPVSHHSPSSESSDSDSDDSSTSVHTRTQVRDDVLLDYDKQRQARTSEEEEAITVPRLPPEEDMILRDWPKIDFFIRTRQPCTPSHFDRLLRPFRHSNTAQQFVYPGIDLHDTSGISRILERCIVWKNKQVKWETEMGVLKVLKYSEWLIHPGTQFKTLFCVCLY